MDVFVSRPTRVEEAFRPGLGVFLTRLTDMGLNPRTVGATDYPTKSPLDGVIHLLDTCRGAVILGYPQIRVQTGSIRGQDLEAPILLPTEWNHIEAGLSYARRLPLLVIHHVGVIRGIFDRGALNGFIFAKDLSDPAWSSGDDISGAIRAWRDEVLGFAPTPESRRHPVYDALLKSKDAIWTVQAINRRIGDPRPVGIHRESAEARIEELTEFYVRVCLLSPMQVVTIPLGDVVVSFDDKRNRPMIQLRA